MTNGRALRARLHPSLPVALALSLSGCRAVELVFKAGVWTAVIGIALLVALAYGAMRLFRRAT